jgi:hypothetical protein
VGGKNQSMLKSMYRPPPLKDPPPTHLTCLCLPSHSQEEFQQCGCLLGQYNPQRGRRCGADSHQSVPEVPHHIPAHPAACSRARLQARPGECPGSITWSLVRRGRGRQRGQQSHLWPARTDFTHSFSHHFSFGIHLWMPRRLQKWD